MERIVTLADIPKVKPGTVAAGTKSLRDVDEDRAVLAQRAADVLGYHTLKGELTGEGTLGKGAGPLAVELLKLEIDVLDTSSVISYQLEEMTRITKEVINGSLRDWATGYFHAATWAKTELKRYTRPIPEFVLAKAVSIKEAIPEVTFHIQHMTDPKADPFLVASVGEEIYYIEAWDEPRFEGRLR